MGNSRANLQTSVPLSNLSIKIANQSENFKASLLFPKKSVAKGTGKIRVYSGDNLIQEAVPLGRRSAAQEIERKYATMAYTTEAFALRELISDRDKRDADDDIADIELDSVQDQTERLLLGLEAAALAKAFTTTNFASGFEGALGGGSEWSNANGTPIDNIKLAQRTVLLGLGGLPADSMALSMATYDILCAHPDIVDRVKYVMGQTAVVNETALAAIFGLKVHVLATVENTAQPSVAGTVTKAFMVSDKCLVYRSAGADGLRSSAFGKMLVPTGGELSVVRYMPENQKGAWIETALEYALQFTAVDSASSGKAIGGYLISNCD